MRARYRAEGEEQAPRIRADADRQSQETLSPAYKEAERIKGEGDADAARIYGEAYARNPALLQIRPHSRGLPQSPRRRDHRRLEFRFRATAAVNKRPMTTSFADKVATGTSVGPGPVATGPRGRSRPTVRTGSRSGPEVAQRRTVHLMSTDHRTTASNRGPVRRRGGPSRRARPIPALAPRNAIASAPPRPYGCSRVYTSSRPTNKPSSLFSARFRKSASCRACISPGPIRSPRHTGSESGNYSEASSAATRPMRFWARVEPFQSQFLTGDRNVIHVRTVVQYSVATPRDYLFPSRRPGSRCSRCRRGGTRPPYRLPDRR